MKKILYLITTLLITLVSCDDSTDTLGSSLIDVNDTIHVESAEYSVASRSVRANNLVARSTTGYLGKIKDPETGLYISGNYMTQFRPLMDGQFEDLDSIYIESYDPTRTKWSQLKCDSCALMLYMPSWYGDSLEQMKLTAHEMRIPYEEGVAYPSDFDPIANGYVRNDAGSIHKQLSYTTSNRVYSLADRTSTNYANNIVKFAIRNLLKRLGNRHRLPNTACFYHNVIKFAAFDDIFNIIYKVGF